jgi:hypothetical protein
MVLTQLQIINKLSSNKLYEGLKTKQEILNTLDFISVKVQMSQCLTVNDYLLVSSQVKPLKFRPHSKSP